MPVVTIAMFDGRSIEQKRELVKGVTDVVARVAGVSADGIHVIIEEVQRENWGIGGLLCSDRQAGRQGGHENGSDTRRERRGGRTAMARVVKIGPRDVPGLELTKGMSTQYNVCGETVGSEFIKMGVCNHAPDMADLKWVAKAEEAFYVAKGSIKLAWEDEDGDNGEVVVREGEQVFLPRGFRYALKSTGEPAVNVFAVGGAPSSIGPAFGPEAQAKLKAAGEELRPR